MDSRFATTEEATAAKETFIAQARTVSPATRRVLVQKLARFAREGYGFERMQLAPGVLVDAATVQATIDAIAAMEG